MEDMCNVYRTRTGTRLFWRQIVSPCTARRVGAVVGADRKAVSDNGHSHRPQSPGGRTNRRGTAEYFVTGLLFTKSLQYFSPKYLFCLLWYRKNPPSMRRHPLSKGGEETPKNGLLETKHTKNPTVFFKTRNPKSLAAQRVSCSRIIPQKETLGNCNWRIVCWSKSESPANRRGFGLWPFKLILCVFDKSFKGFAPYVSELFSCPF